MNWFVINSDCNHWRNYFTYNKWFHWECTGFLIWKTVQLMDWNWFFVFIGKPKTNAPLKHVFGCCSFHWYFEFWTSCKFCYKICPKERVNNLWKIMFILVLVEKLSREVLKNRVVAWPYSSRKCLWLLCANRLALIDLDFDYSKQSHNT